MQPDYQIFPLGDSAATLSLGNGIDEMLNKKVLAMQAWLRANPFYGLKDMIAAYSSLTVIYDPILIRKKYPALSTVFTCVRESLEQAFFRSQPEGIMNGDLVNIPVCYDDPHSMDLEALSLEKQLSREDIIEMHLAGLYRVYMIGFLPGFSYLASVTEKLYTPRKERPVMVQPGSVGIAGWQTGIYPFTSPGGWHIIGRTPLQLFQPFSDRPVLMKTGDSVRFYRITGEEFQALAAGASLSSNSP